MPESKLLFEWLRLCCAALRQRRGIPPAKLFYARWHYTKGPDVPCLSPLSSTMESPQAFERSSNSQLCPLCLKLAEQDLDFLLHGPMQVPREVVHHLSYTDLAGSARSGCPLCALFRDAVFRQNRSNDANEAREDRRRAAAGRETAFRFFTNFGKLPGEDLFAAHVVSLRYGRVTTVHDSKARFKGHHTAYGSPRFDRSTVSTDDLGVFDALETTRLDALIFSYPTAGASSTRELPKDEKYDNAGEIHLAVVDGCHEYQIKRCAISLNANYNIAREWLQSCSRHKACRLFEICTLPSRVIEVSGKDFPPTIRLLETNGKSGQYLTLTHCWGREPIKAKTIGANVSNYKTKIPFEELPLNFQDAIIVTRELDFEYIWIDSLCIIQDSLQDWEIECSRMAAIFANSVLTIAGAAAGFANHGFLHPRPRPSSSIQIDIKRESLSTGTMMLDVSDDWSLQPIQQPDSPLSKRGWILQERLLSPRILYFGSRQMYFECDSSERYESHPTSTLPQINSPATMLQTAVPFGKNVLSDTSQRSVYALWYSIVVACSNCQLTNGDDRLPSLSGLASRFRSKLKGDEYLAGIWRGDMVHGLLWYRQYPNAHPQSVNAPQIGAPSWSWVSCDRPVQFYVDRWEGWADGYGWKPFVLEMQTLLISATPTGLDPFGRVEQGTWKVRGRMTECILRFLQNDDGSSDWFVCRSHDEQPLSVFLPDGGEFDRAEPGRHTGIFALLLGQKPAAIRNAPLKYALLLRPVGGRSSTFERIGITSLGYERQHLPASKESIAWLESGSNGVVDIV